jgi:beta-lactamase superfamily II metal-dependent hydrolase
MYEIDFLPVEHGEKSGDAISGRFSVDGSGSRSVTFVVDGGYAEDGESLAAHIRRYYGAERIDLVISTHPDADHVTGLKTIVEQFEVGELLMHQPWAHSPDVAKMAGTRFAEARAPKLREALRAADDLYSLAVLRGTRVTEPFAGLERFDGALLVVGPSLEFYEEQLSGFRQPSAVARLTEAMKGLVTEARRRVRESLTEENLSDAGETSPENESSTILLLSVDERRLLLTGDAGHQGLGHAADVLEGIRAADFAFVQVPHHGSRRNVGPTILNRILGGYPASGRGTSFVSASQESPKHPSPLVTNAFARRGYEVVSTEGKAIRHGHEAPPRQGWYPATPLPFVTNVEVEDE